MMTWPRRVLCFQGADIHKHAFGGLRPPATVSQPFGLQRPQNLANLIQVSRSGAVWRSGTGVPPVNHAQDARATFKLHHHQVSQVN
jgi:hypothetical protein